MIIWFALLIPLIGAAALYWVFYHKVMLWEAGVMVAAPIFFIALAKGCSEYSQTRDTEYWGGYVTGAAYFEDWNERVSCRHPKYKTVRRTRTVYRDGKSYTESYTTQVQDGYHHSYDVDYHPEYWELYTSLGGSYSASKDQFDKFCVQFGNRSFVDMRRSYHTDDGDKYETRFGGEPEKLEAVTVEKSYENRVQASQSVFNFKEVDPKVYGLFEYPSVRGLMQHCILGPGSTHSAEKKLQYLNATLGSSKQVRLFILVFQGEPIQAAMEQEAYWKRGNKNELVTCIGVDRDLAIQWAHVFSWTEVDALKIEARNAVMEQKTLDLGKYIDWLGPAVQSKWVRKQFAEFSYLTVEPSTAAVVWAFIGTIIITVGVGIWAVMNETDPERSEHLSSRYSGWGAEHLQAVVRRMSGIGKR